TGPEGDAEEEDAEAEDAEGQDSAGEDATSDATEPGGAEDAAVEDAAQEEDPPCIPACDGKNCGADGCGNLCGICLGETECVDGLCTSTEEAPDALIDQAVPVSGGSPYVSGELYAMTVDTSYRVVVFWRGDNQDGTDDLLLSSSDPLVTEFAAPYVLKAGVDSLPISSGGDMDTAGGDLIFTWRDEVSPCDGKLCGETCTNCYPGEENCFDLGVGKACDVYGSCVATEALECAGPIATDCQTHPCGWYCDPCLDVLEDGDGDGIPDVQDLFPSDPSESGDGDQDGIGDNADTDDDNDGTPDDIDADDDNDGTTDEDDALPSNPNETVDTDGDGMGDNSDPDPEEAYGPCDDSLPHSCASNGACEITGTFLCKEPVAGNNLVMFRRAALPDLEGEDVVIFETPWGTELWRPHIVKRDAETFCVL
ncbi:MAG: hypothetical protein VX938_04365, partial [Myxococcota bacterium]|nr:hypothetical protein [Myxococcota bacterium]